MSLKCLGISDVSMFWISCIIEVLMFRFIFQGGYMYGSGESNLGIVVFVVSSHFLIRVDIG